MRNRFHLVGVHALSVIGAIIFSTTAFAENLVWKSTEIAMTASVDQDSVEAIYHFKNSGREEVTIISVSTSCGCTVAAPDKKTYAAGEEGEIKALFTIGERIGPQEKTILVETSDSTEPTTLTLKVAIPEVFALEPRLLMWSAGTNGPVEERAATIAASPDRTISIASIQSESPDLETRVITEEVGKRYRVMLRPKSVATPFKTVVRLRIACPPGKDRAEIIYAIIR